MIMASGVVTVMKKGGSVRRTAIDVLASPRTFWVGAPVEPGDPTTTIGAATTFPRVPGIRAIPIPTRMIIDAVFFPCTTESSTPKDAATEGARERNAQWSEAPEADASLAIDREVVLARIHEVDDPRDSGAGKLSPGVSMD
jgi:hypothetical protein